jgi:two-component system chemotaxis sensor kinase CheA
MQGMEIELDRSILELLGDPLAHLLRNSVDHGIETQAERIAAGKPAAGRVCISVARYKDQVEIRIEDDGKGIDPAKIAAAAVTKGFITAEQAARLSAEEQLMLICHPGFSTAATVTDISGRGVGMDVVRTTIQSLKGTMTIFSEPGKGSCFQLRLPLTLAIINVLLVKAGGLTLAVPLTAVSRTMELRSEEIATIDDKDVFFHGEETVPLLPLGRLLGLGSDEAHQTETLPLLITEVNDRKTALQVDRILGTQEVFVKPLGRPLAAMPGFSGATILGGGEIVFILDIINRVL